ncbi:MAG: hypothetical protein KBA26_14230, partial [Candidatus Delongbacteria bacterium]|nr:hypothetical protein [Candidatus Delongbacteria bacterium]
MAIQDDLVRFIRKGLEQGHSRSELKQILIQAGWDLEQVQDALAEFAELDFPLPVPKPRPYLSAKEAFLYFMLFSTLVLSAFHLGALGFTFIDLIWPDPLSGTDGITQAHESIRWTLSTLMIVFPLFLIIRRIIQRNAQLQPGKPGSRIRKWLTYLTLLVAAGTLIGDMIALLSSFLGGDITLRFLLKTGVIGLIAGTTLIYYLLDLRQTEEERSGRDSRFRTGFHWGVIAVILVAVIAGIINLGSPKQQRLLRMDSQRIHHFKTIRTGIETYWSRHHRLPANLDSLAQEPELFIESLDPEHQTPYDYRIIDSTHYELCAVFS